MRFVYTKDRREYHGFNAKNNDLPDPWLRIFADTAKYNGDSLDEAINAVLPNSRGDFKLWLEYRYEEFIILSPEEFKMAFKTMFKVKPWRELQENVNLAYIKKGESVRSYLLRMNKYCSSPDSPYNQIKSDLLRNVIPEELKDLLLKYEMEYYSEKGSSPPDNVFMELIIRADDVNSYIKARSIIKLSGNRQTTNYKRNKAPTNLCKECGKRV
jgi:hypothetical protein